MKLKKIFKKIKYSFSESIDSIIFVILLAIIAGCIALIFKYSKYGFFLEIKDYFNFAGTFGGAILGGLISLIILKTTLESQKEEFENQKNIEDQRREEDAKQFRLQLQEERSRFEKQCEITLLNDKLSEYKNVYYSTSELREKIARLYMDIAKGIYDDNLQNLVDDIRGLMICRDKKIIDGLVIKNSEYKLQEENIVRKFDEIFSLTRQMFVIQDMKNEIEILGNLIKEQLILLKNLISDLNNTKYNC